MASEFVVLASLSMFLYGNHFSFDRKHSFDLETCLHLWRSPSISMYLMIKMRKAIFPEASKPIVMQKNGEKNRQIKSELISSWACVGAFVGYFLLNNSFADHIAWANYRMSDKAYDSFCQTGDFILKLYLMFYQKHSRTRCRKCIHEQNFA